MKRQGWTVASMGALAAGVLVMATAGPARADSLVEETRAFLDAYARGDWPAVRAKLDPSVVIYGGDAAEVFHGVEGAQRMMHDDHALWRGPARIGAPEQLARACGGSLCVVTFQAPFILAPRPPVLVRFTLTWRRGPGGWRLLQSVNASPTVGQSAATLLSGEKR